MRNLTRLELFKEIYDMELYNALCYSKDFLMTEPKEQYVAQWKKVKEKVQLLNEIIEEEKQKIENQTSSQKQISSEVTDDEIEELE